MNRPTDVFASTHRTLQVSNGIDIQADIPDCQLSLPPPPLQLSFSVDLVIGNRRDCRSIRFLDPEPSHIKRR